MTLHPIPSPPQTASRTSLFPSRTHSLSLSLVSDRSSRSRSLASGQYGRVGADRKEGKRQREERERREGAWASARYWCIKRAYLRSLFSRMWTPGMRRSREEGNRAPYCITSAIYLFYPGGWIKLVYGTRTPRGVRTLRRKVCTELARKRGFARNEWRQRPTWRRWRSRSRFSGEQKGNGTTRREKMRLCVRNTYLHLVLRWWGYFISFLSIYQRWTIARSEANNLSHFFVETILAIELW